MVINQISLQRAGSNQKETGGGM